MVAEALGWRTHRRKRAALSDLEAAAEELRSYIQQLPVHLRKRVPTQAEITAAGRHDLRYALKVHQRYTRLVFTLVDTHSLLSSCQGLL